MKQTSILTDRADFLDIMCDESKEKTGLNFVNEDVVIVVWKHGSSLSTAQLMNIQS
jgi:hypothetical protein